MKIEDGEMRIKSLRGFYWVQKYNTGIWLMVKSFDTYGKAKDFIEQEEKDDA